MMDSPADSICGRGHTSGGSLGIRHSLDHSLVPPAVVAARAAWCSSGRPAAFANATLVAAPPRPDPVSLLSSSTRPQHGRFRQLGGRAGSASRAARAAVVGNASAVDGLPSAGARIAACAATQVVKRNTVGTGLPHTHAFPMHFNGGAGPWAKARHLGLGPQGQKVQQPVDDGKGASCSTASATTATRLLHPSTSSAAAIDARGKGIMRGTAVTSVHRLSMLIRRAYSHRPGAGPPIA